jgi:sec-independent protein translocase protein TatB
MRKIGRVMARARAMANEFRSSFDEMARQSELDELRKEVQALRTGQGMVPLGAEADAALSETSASVTGSDAAASADGAAETGTDIAASDDGAAGTGADAVIFQALGPTPEGGVS